MNAFWTLAIKNWKTTAKGLLSATIAVIVAIMTLPDGTKTIVCVLAGARALVGILETDQV